jgi:asparaginyl-tRNA synthetase
MTTTATIANIASFADQEVTLNGWIYNIRSSGKIAFPQLRDGTGVLQCVASKADLGEDVFASIRQLGQESSLSLTGTIRADERALGGFEMQVSSVEIHQNVSGYPISPKEHGPQFLHDHRHLWMRSKKQQAILKIRHLCVKAIRDYFDERDFLLLDSPIFTPNPCEGTSTLFETDYFGQPAYLSQSGQLYQEAGAMAFGKTYTFGPTFRAEKSSTRRHLTEFWMVEPELAYANLDDIMDLAEDFMVEVVQNVLNNGGREHLTTLERDISVLENVQKPFPRMSYDEACEQLQGLGSPVDPDNDFGAPHETALTKKYDRPIMIHRYPTAVKAFYFKQDPENPARVLGMDMLAPEGYGEIIGSGQREDSEEVLLQKISDHGLNQDHFEWYLDLRRYGSVPHGGFGLGLERLVCWMCGIKHIRETVPFPRMMDRLKP